MSRCELKSVFRDWLDSKGLWDVYVREWNTEHGCVDYGHVDGCYDEDYDRVDEWLDETSVGLWLQSAFTWNKTKSKVNWGKLNDEWIEVWCDREL